MKFFAVRPDNYNADMVISALPFLESSGVKFLYLKDMLSRDEIVKIINALDNSVIIPIVSHKLMAGLAGNSVGIHYKSSEIDLIINKKPGYAIVTASAHDYDTARYLFKNGADYVYVSPVFKPLSKHNDKRDLFPLERIIRLTNDFEENLVLLGGMTNDRIEELKENIGKDFSVAGITMFFGKGQIY
jgi:thiamine monophosphate synthase